MLFLMLKSLKNTIYEFKKIVYLTIYTNIIYL